MMSAPDVAGTPTQYGDYRVEVDVYELDRDEIPSQRRTSPASQPGGDWAEMERAGWSAPARDERGWRTRQAEERLLVGPGYDDRGLVFCHPDGRRYHPDRFSREFDPARRRATASPASDCTTSDTLGRRSLCRPAST